MTADNAKSIAYLASEIPALSATFVYEEILGLERKGYTIIPVSVRQPGIVAKKQTELLERTRFLYEDSVGAKLLALLKNATKNPLKFARAAGLLLSDIARSNPLRISSWKLAYQFLAGCQLAVIMRENRCTHLHVHFAHVPTQIGMYASAISGVPFTFVAHANDIFERAFLLIQKTARAKQLITISEFNRSYLVEKGIPANKISIVRCGVSIESTQKSYRPSPEKAFRVGTLGRLVEKKGIDILIKSCAILKEHSFSVTLEICGDGPLRHPLEELVRKHDLVDNVRFLGSISHDKVADWLKQLDLFVLACRTDSKGDKDGIPVVLMEAMSQSIPVISTYVSGIPELVIPDHTGLLADPNNPEDLAEKMSDLLDNAEEREKLAEGALKHVESEFSMKANLDRLEQWFSGPQ